MRRSVRARAQLWAGTIRLVAIWVNSEATPLKEPEHPVRPAGLRLIVARVPRVTRCLYLAGRPPRVQPKPVAEPAWVDGVGLVEIMVA